MNYIQEHTTEVRFHTSMIDVAHWLEIDLQDFDWHLSDLEVFCPDLTDPAWLSGEDFAAMLQTSDYQFVWAVISALPKGKKPFTSDVPFADGNPDFWLGSPKKQLNNSLFEIVCWDSSATLFIGLSEAMGKTLIANAPGIKDLDQMNQLLNSPHLDQHP